MEEKFGRRVSIEAGIYLIIFGRGRGGGGGGGGGELDSICMYCI